jgi:hypothetical protein
MATKKKAAPWERSAPKKVQKRGTKHLTPAQKKHAAQRAKSAGRSYPNMVDNMHEAQAAKATKKKATKKKATKKSASKKTSTRKASTKKSSARKAATKKRVTKRAGAKKKTSAKRKGTRKKATRRTKSKEKDPRGGLTAAGRRAFHERDGSNLKPGVKKKAGAMSVSEMKRKGSWAVRFYGRKKLPALVDADGQPTRFALSAAAWGEPVPRTEAAARKIADKGHRLLERARG